MAKAFQLVRHADGALRPRDRTAGVLKPVRQRAYSMADTGRLFADWSGSVESFHNNMRASMVTMMNRARDLAENDPTCIRFLRLMETNVFGPNGIVVVPTPHDERGRIDRADAKLLRESWEGWGLPGTATKNRIECWRENEGIAFKNLLTYGNAFRRFVPDPGNPWAFAVHLIDPARLDYLLCRAKGNGQHEIRNGVEIDEWGAPIAYHFLKDDHNGMMVTGHEVIEAKWINHIFLKERSRQTVGVTWFAPVGARKKLLDGYEIAAVVAARTAASKMGFFQRTGEQSPEWIPGGEEMPPEDVSPGMMEILPDGYEFKDFDPSWPSMNDEAFVKGVKRTIAAGLNFSYNSLAMDLESVSWSGLRSAELGDHDFCRMMQAVWAMKSTRPTYLKWLRFALDFGALPLPAYKFDKFSSAKFRGRAWQWVNPKQQQEANQIGLRNGSLLLSRLIEEDMGMSLEEWKETMALELETLGDMHPLHWLKDKPDQPAPETQDPADPQQ